ncbi:MAG: acyl-CoA synthase [Dehalococcoidia bacterium]|nr:acyl-CoA synthase [Dehalococcoidia bacterium]|tara:strand:+ start:7511 stop:8320 length:810 start_codon:yes stop_codon:yes gene_type:complete
MALDVLLVTKGHVFDYNGFYAMFDENPQLNTTQVEQPAAQVMLRPENVADYDAVVFYDMWGFTPDDSGNYQLPPEDYQHSIKALLEQGIGLVLLNHAIVQWPGWPLWKEVHGSSFTMRETVLDGVKVPVSGYRGGGHDPRGNITHFLSVCDSSHPVLQGLGDGFEVTDELYLKTATFESRPDIVPLLRSDYSWVQENFNSLGPPEQRSNWNHPEGSNLVAWAKRSHNSPVVATDGGDGPSAYENPAFRQFLTNAITWVASDAAKEWARS